MKPLVSVCIPTYNGGRFIQEALASAAAQTYDNLEIIISDDRSGDDTLAIARQFAATSKHPVRIIEHTPAGMFANWNDTAHAAKGEWVKFLFQDDTLDPACIEKMVELGESDPRIGLVFSPRLFIVDPDDEADEHVKIMRSRYAQLHKGWTKLERVQSGAALLGDRNLLEEPANKIGEPTVVMFRKSVFEKVGDFDKDLKQLLDFEMWVRLMTACHVGFIDEPLMKFRLHRKQMTQQNRDAGELDADLFRYWEKLVKGSASAHLHPDLKHRLMDHFHGSQHVEERMTPEAAEDRIFWEHVYRYRFATTFAKGRRVLDIACGEGYGTRALADSGAASALGMDIAEDACANARQKYGVEARVGDACNIPLPDASMDLVVSFETIEHVPDAERFLDECRRILAPGGMLVVSTPNRAVNADKGWDNPFHTRELYEHEFEEYLGKRFSSFKLFTQGIISARPWSLRSIAAEVSPWRRLAQTWVRWDGLLRKLPGYWRIRNRLVEYGRSVNLPGLDQARTNTPAAVVGRDGFVERLGNYFSVRSRSKWSGEQINYLIAVATK